MRCPKTRVPVALPARCPPPAEFGSDPLPGRLRFGAHPKRPALFGSLRLVALERVPLPLPPCRIASLKMLPSGGRCLTKTATHGGRHREATMARNVSMETRRNLIQAISERYRGSRKGAKLRILDEFVALTG